MKLKRYIQYKNWRWWVALPLTLVLITLLSPLIIFGALIDLASKIFDIIYTFIDNLCGKYMRNINKWVNRK